MNRRKYCMRCAQWNFTLSRIGRQAQEAHHLHLPGKGIAHAGVPRRRNVGRAIGERIELLGLKGFARRKSW